MAILIILGPRESELCPFRDDQYASWKFKENYKADTKFLKLKCM